MEQKHGHRSGEPADVLLGDAAFAQRHAPRAALEEPAQPLLDVGVAVAVGVAHERDHALEIPVGIVAAVLGQVSQKHLHELQVEGVLPGLEVLVVVDARLAPVAGLVVQDVGVGIGRCVVRPVQDASGMGVARRHEVAHLTVVAP